MPKGSRSEPSIASWRRSRTFFSTWSSGRHEKDPCRRPQGVSADLARSALAADLDVRAVLVIPSGLERKLLTRQRVPVQVIINGDNSNAAATVMGYALRILQTS